MAAIALTISDLGADLTASLEEAARRQGKTASALARDLIVFGLTARPPAVPPDPRPLLPEEARCRADLMDDLRRLRAMTLAPHQFDSTLAIRQSRDLE